MKNNYIFLFMLLLLLTGCGGGSSYTIKPEWDKSKLATIYVYRTKVAFHSANPENPFFYIDDQQFAKLGTGGAASIKVLPGKHIITVKEPFMFTPSYENARIEVQAEEAKEYFIRYSKEPSLIIISGSSANVAGESTIHIVNEEYYNQRK